MPPFALGSRLCELDALQISGEDLGLQYKNKLSELQGVDFNKAVSDLNQQQTSLTATQNLSSKYQTCPCLIISGDWLPLQLALKGCI